MKTLRAAFAGFLFLAAPLLAARPDYQILKISPSACTTPLVSYTLGPQHTTPRAQTWLEVEVNFMSNIPFTDELTFRYFIVVAGQCLTGEVTHVAIQRGRDLYSVMYVPPQALAQMLKGKPLTGADIGDVGVELVHQGQILQTKSFKAQGETQWWQNMKQVPGLVLNKNQTPFTSLFWDRYEMIKIPANPQ